MPKVDPQNADIVYSASIVTWRSMDGGKTWTGIKGAPGGDDYQNIWINPSDPRIILLVSDQGAVVSVNRGRTWSSWYNQPTAQLYHVAATNSFPYRVCGGQQESGSVCISTRGNDGAITFREWHPAGVIEYGYAAPDPLDPDIVYGAGRGQVSKFHWKTGQVQMATPAPLPGKSERADRTQPVLFSPIDPHVLYYASNVLRKTSGGAHSWQIISPDLSRPHSAVPASLGVMAANDLNADKQRGVIYSLAPSFKNINTIWAGTDDGLIWATRDGGKKWKDVTPPELTPWSKVTQLEASHFDGDAAYASVSRFRVNDVKPYVYRTHDGGKTWKLITAGLPNDSPVDTVREDPVRRGLLFAGTETAVWVSFDDGDHWQSLQLNLPHTSMRDLAIHGSDLIVATHGRSFWVLDDITPLRQISERVTQSNAWLFQPAQAYRVRRDTNPDTPLPPDEPMGENPPDGAVLDYFLGQSESEPVTLDILDSKGKLVRHYASTDDLETSGADPKTLAIPLFWVREPQVLSAKAGIHRFLWDLHYAPPDSLRHEYPISAIPHDTPRLPLGARVLPGVYVARLTVNGRSSATSLVVKMDPRVKTSLTGLQRQFEIERQLTSMMTRSTKAVRQARSLEEQIGKIAEGANGALGGQLAALRKKLKTELAAADPAKPTLIQVNGRASALYSDVDSADALPTVAQETAITQLETDFPAVMKRWSTLANEEIPALNQQLRSANLPEIRLDAKSSHDEDDADSDLD
ncbi:MAG: hypothetical protein M3Y27_12300 [Acidobacteriota bacterium]|nr:hypothetical protein [Acidobacteriota bacterium]